jgi:hypothetical protein
MAGSSLHVLPVQLSFQRLRFDLPALCGPHVGSVPHSTHGSTSQCLAAHCTFALSPRLLLAPCSHARHPRSRSVSVAAQHQRFGNSHQAGRTDGNLPRLDPFRHFCPSAATTRRAFALSAPAGLHASFRPAPSRQFRTRSRGAWRRSPSWSSWAASCAHGCTACKGRLQVWRARRFQRIPPHKSISCRVWRACAAMRKSRLDLSTGLQLRRSLTSPLLRSR